MPQFTIFYSHPQHLYADNHYTANYQSARAAGEDAVEMLPEDFIDLEYPVVGVYGVDEDNYEDCVWDYESQCRGIRDELSVKVYAGEHGSMPATPPDWEYV